MLQVSESLAGVFADIVGTPYMTGAAKNMGKDAPIAVLGRGLQLPTLMKYSHSLEGDNYRLVCHRVSGDLYMAMAVEDNEPCDLIMVVLLDKSKFHSTVKDVGSENITNFVNTRDFRKELDTMDDYLRVMYPFIVSAWFKESEYTDNYVEMDLEDFKPTE